MTRTLLLFYGLCAWGAGCNLPAWARLLWQRWRGGAGLRHDVYLVVRAGVFLSALGTLGLAGDRVRGSVRGTMPLAVPSPIGLVSIALMAGAEIVFLHAASINARARGEVGWAWRMYWIGAAVWFALVTTGGVR